MHFILSQVSFDIPPHYVWNILYSVLNRLLKKKFNITFLEHPLICHNLDKFFFIQLE